MNESFAHTDPSVIRFSRALAAEVSPAAFEKAIEDFSSLRVLVIGDTIFDRYSYVTVQGLTSKNRIISGRYLNEETQAGGALAVFRHVRQFTPQVTYLSLAGTEPWVESALGQYLDESRDRVVRDSHFTTIIKQRYVEPLNKGKELSKLFAVNFLNPDPPSQPILDRLSEAIQREVRQADLVLLLDFGHGLMQPGVRRQVQESAPFLALNCQTNSNNHGFNIISRQYERADAFSLDAQELMLSCGHRHLDFSQELESLRKSFKARYAWLTRGPVETIGRIEGGSPCLCPPLENDVVDTVGAGDAFFSVASLAAARGLPVALGTFMGQLAGAQAVRIVGNAKPISKPVLLEAGRRLLESTEDSTDTA